MKLLEIPLYPPKKSAAQKICTKRPKLPRKNIICKTASKQRAPPKKSQNHLSTQKIVKVLQKLRKSPENTKKSEVNPKQQKISHCKVFQKIPAQKGKFPHNFPHNRANSRTKPPNSRTRAAENCPKTGFWAKFAFLAFLVHKHRFFSESVPKRPETAFSDKNCIFCFVSRKQFFFSEFKYEVVFASFLPLKMFLRKNSRVFWLAWSSNSQLKEVD